MLRLLEHVLAEDAVVQAGGRDRTDMVEAAGLQRPGQRQRMAGAVYIGFQLMRGVGTQVVDRGQVEKMVDPAGQGLQVGGGHAAAVLPDVADDRQRTRLCSAEVFPQRLLPSTALLAHQEIDRIACIPQQL